ncbi:MAG: CRTAC1 family protein [Acidobacteriota bacterium]
MTRNILGLMVIAGLLAVPAVQADNPAIQFEPADDPDIQSFGRSPSPEFQTQLDLWEATLTDPINVVADPDFWVPFPLRSRGMPGMVAFDYDGDGDVDLYVSNGPGASNLLLANQLRETGTANFVDVTDAAGVALTDHDTNGVCAGDLDNDGDMELFAVGRNEASVLLANNGDGTFTDITAASLVDDAGRTGGSSCQFGDIDNDGLLDLLVVRFEDQADHAACQVANHPDNQPNDLWRNLGGNQFTEVSDTSGIRTQVPHPALTHDATFVDFDEDGDVDIVLVDDQCAAPFVDLDPVNGMDVGFIQVFENDGTGQFTPTTSMAGTEHYGAWMGLAWGDFDIDGNLDFYATNGGGYAFSVFQPPGVWQPTWNTGRIFLGDGDGTFVDRRWPDEPEFNENSVFGWSAHAEDFDLDGDLDILYFGGLDNIILLDRSNPGTLIVNEGDGTFRHGGTPFQLRHARRNVHGSVTADFDEDGRVDVASVSNHDVPDALPLIPYAALGTVHNSVFDDTATAAPYGDIDALGNFVWNGVTYPNGTVAVDFNSTETTYNYIKVTPVGSVGLTDGAITNRDGVGAIITVLPKDRPKVRRPTGQSTYLSQSDRTFTAGLQRADWGKIEVMWPGGTRNRLYDVRQSEHIVFPEIPCSFDDTDLTFNVYLVCVRWSLVDLVDAEIITMNEAFHFHLSAIRAWLDFHDEDPH